VAAGPDDGAGGASDALLASLTSLGQIHIEGNGFGGLKMNAVLALPKCRSISHDGNAEAAELDDGAGGAGYGLLCT
jgi:hypothetical protein